MTVPQVCALGADLLRILTGIQVLLWRKVLQTELCNRVIWKPQA